MIFFGVPITNKQSRILLSRLLYARNFLLLLVSLLEEETMAHPLDFFGLVRKIV